MSVSISAPVGYHGKTSGNKPGDVAAVHGLLARVPAGKGGPGAGFNANAGYSARTDQAIFNFQKFNKLPVTDATVTPGQDTLALLNRLAEGSASPTPVSPPAPTPAPTVGVRPGAVPSPHVDPLPVLAVVTAAIVGHAYIKGFDNKANPNRHLGRFRVPLYRLKVGRAETSGGAWTLGASFFEFDVVRFGVAFDSALYDASPTFKAFKMQGPPTGEFPLKRESYMGGAWLIKGNYFIHPGPAYPHHKATDSTLKELPGALGCVELTWPQAMGKFDERVRTLAFGDLYEIGFYDAKEADQRITEAAAFRAMIEPAPTPALQTLTDFTAIGGPKPISG